MAEPSNTFELAALYAAGALSPAERAEFEQLMTREPAAAEILRSFGGVVEALASSVPGPTAPGTVKSRLLEQLDAREAPSGGDQVTVQRADQGEWQDIGIPGAQMRQLFVDEARKIQTFLIRMEPGCRVPSHPHPGVEECYILEGDLHTYDTVLRAGDYMRAEAGTQHTDSFTENGCLMLVTAALDAA